MKRTCIKTLLLSPVIIFFVSQIPASVSAQEAGNLDETFNPTDLGDGLGDGFNNHVYGIVPLPEGKHLIFGNFSTFQGKNTGAVVALNEDGTRDPTFANGFTGSDGPDAAVVQADGKIIVGGFFNTYGGTSIKNMARLNTDGTLDPSFDPGQSADNYIRAIAVQGDGKIIIAGDFETFNEVPVKYLVRLNADGSLDETFTPGTGPNARLTGVAVQDDGKILIGGYFTSYDGTAAGRLARLNTDGTIDETFDPGSGAAQPVDIIKVLNDGKILIGGSFNNFNGAAHGRILRLNEDGSIDNTFAAGTGFNSFVRAITVQADNKILVGGTFTDYNGTALSGIARLNADGSIDIAFDTGTGISGPNKTVQCIGVDASERILIGGNFTSYNGRSARSLIRLLPGGGADESVLQGYGASGTVYDAKLLPDGKIIIAGGFFGYNGVARNGIARLNADGSIDETFDPGDGTGQVRSIAIQPDGKIVVAGTFQTYNNTSRNRIARIHADGSLDTSFDPGTGLNGSAYCLALQEDGKILVAGAFQSFNGVARKRIARLNADGSLDATFDPGTGTDGAVHTMAVQDDGRVLIGGSFSTYNDVSRARLARLDANGALDETFDVGLGTDNFIEEIKVLPDQWILIGGSFTTYDGSTANRMARLHSDGSIDPEFSVGTGVNGTIEAITIHQDGKIFVGGNFTMLNGRSAWNVARLYSDGTHDFAFNTHIGPNRHVYAIAIQSDDKVVIVGEFIQYRNVGRNRVTRVHGGKGTPVITWPSLNNINYGTPLSSTQLKATTTVPGTFTYDPPAGTILNVGDNQVLSVDFEPADPGSWISARAEALINVLPASQTIAFDPLPDRVIGDEDFEISATASSGLLVTFESSNTDVVTVNGNIVTIVGTGLVSIKASQAGNSNYLAAPNVDRAFRVKDTQTITLDDIAPKTFGDADFTLPLTASSGLGIVYSSSNTNVATVTLNNVTLVGAGETIITATQPGNAFWAEASPVEKTLTVSKADQVINFGPLEVKRIDDDPFVLTASSSSGLPVAYTSSNTSVAIVSGDAVSIVGPGTTVITASEPGNSNYKPAAAVEQTLTVKKLTQVIDFAPLPTDKIYGDAPFMLDATTTSGLSLTFESSNTSVATISGNTVTIVGAGETEITARQTGNGTFEPTSAAQILAVGRATQYIDFSNFEDVVYGAGAFQLSATSSSGLPVSFSSSDPLVATVEGDMVTITGAGTAVISAMQTGSINYEDAVEQQGLSVFKASQSISFGEFEIMTYGQDDVELTATASSGLPVTYESSNPAVATIAGNMLSIHKAGFATITAAQPGDANFDAASESARQLIVEKAGQTITFSPLPEKLTTDVPFQLSATSSSGLPVGFFSTDVQVAFVVDNTVTLVGAGVTQIMAVQNGNENFFEAPAVFVDLVVRDPQTITFEALADKAFGDEPFSLNATASSALPVVYASSNPLVATVADNLVTIVGVGTTTITATQEGDARYAAAPSVSRTLDVHRASQEITFEAPAPVTTLDEPFTLEVTATSGLEVSLTSSDPAVAEVIGTRVTIMGPGITTLTAEQNGNDFYEPATPVSHELVVDLVTSAESSASQRMKIYPNPTDGALWIEFIRGTNMPTDITVYNTLNGIVWTTAYRGTEDHLTLDLSDLPKGIYVIEVKNQSHRSVQRLVRK